MLSFIKAALMLAVIAFFAQGAACQAVTDGGVSLSKTRLIFLSTDKGKTLTVGNSSDAHYLIQVRNVCDRHSDKSGPFSVTPPLFTLTGHQQQRLRILKNSDDMPADRESLSYLVVMAIPAQAEPAVPADKSKAARLSVGFRFTIKVLYRPAMLSVPRTDAAAGLKIHQKAGGIEIVNPGPYYLTLARLFTDNLHNSILARPLTIPPFNRAVVKTDHRAHSVSWCVINDYGAFSKIYHSDVP